MLDSNYIIDFVGNSFCLQTLLLEDEETDKLLDLFPRISKDIDHIHDYIYEYRDPLNFDFVLSSVLDDDAATIRIKDLKTGEVIDHLLANRCERQIGIDVDFNDEFNKLITYDTMKNDTNSLPEMMFQATSNRVPTHRDIVLVISEIKIADQTFKVYRPEVYLRGVLLYQYEPETLYGMIGKYDVREEGYEIRRKVE